QSGQVFVYVLEAVHKLGFNDHRRKVLQIGEMFYEASGRLHRVSRNLAAKANARPGSGPAPAGCPADHTTGAEEVIRPGGRTHVQPVSTSLARGLAASRGPGLLVPLRGCRSLRPVGPIWRRRGGMGRL